MDNQLDAKLNEYDHRTANINIDGPKMGIAKRQPVGIEGAPKKEYAIPCGRVKTMRIDEKA